MHVPHEPHEPHEQPGSQVLERLRVPESQLPHGASDVSSDPTAHPPVDMHAPHVPQSFQLHASLQVRVRVFSSPQEPQPMRSLSLWVAAHSPSSVQDSASHSQFGRQMRRNVPQLPHVPRLSIVPTLHAPSPAHPPSSSQFPDVLQIWAWEPQLPQFTLRTSSRVQSHSAGASQSSQVPITQRSIPGAQALAQSR
jgi:hypothetical protein